jgi:hypothetical protein
MSPTYLKNLMSPRSLPNRLNLKSHSILIFRLSRGYRMNLSYQNYHCYQRSRRCRVCQTTHLTHAIQQNRMYRKNHWCLMCRAYRLIPMFQRYRGSHYFRMSHECQLNLTFRLCHENLYYPRCPKIQMCLNCHVIHPYLMFPKFHLTQRSPMFHEYQKFHLNLMSLMNQN